MKNKITKYFKKYFKLKFKKSNSHIIIITIAIVMIRRGVWGLLDNFLFPNNELLSYIIGAVIGIIVLYLDDKKVDELGHH